MGLAGVSPRARTGFKGARRLWDTFGTSLSDRRRMLYTAKCFWPGVTEDTLRKAATRAGTYRAAAAGRVPGDPAPQLTLDHTRVTRHTLFGTPGVAVQGGGLYTPGFQVSAIDTLIERNRPDQCFGC